MYLSRSLADKSEEEFCFFTKCPVKKQNVPIYIEESIGEWAGRQMQEGNALLFIGACGIAVRAVAPYITDKLHDSPVIVMDERGQYVIPVLSGHMGGANELASDIAARIGAIPVITTATDLNRKFAVDLFARKNNLFIMNKEGIARVSSKVLAGKTITISVSPERIRGNGRLPKEVRIVPYPPAEAVDVVISGENKIFNTLILLRPREYTIGVGCRKGKEVEEIEAFLEKNMKEAEILMSQAASLASITLKRKEEGFLAWSRKAGVPFHTYTAEELQELEGDFHESSFVKGIAGIGNVCERAALKAAGSGGKLVYGKHAEDGMTVAIAKKEWSVRFDET